MILKLMAPYIKKSTMCLQRLLYVKMQEKKNHVAKTKTYSSVENNTFSRFGLIVTIKMIKWLQQRDTMKSRRSKKEIGSRIS